MLSTPEDAFAASTLGTNQFLYANQNQQLVSANGGFKLVMQSDSVLVLYYIGSEQDGIPSRVLWSRGTYMANPPALGVVMQDDGNLVIYNTAWTPIWWSNSCCYSPREAFRLDLQDDGNAVIYRPSGASVWSTETYNARNTESFGAGDCWRPGTPLSCRNTWSGRNAFIYFRAIDEFSDNRPAWRTGAEGGVNAWNYSPGPQKYSFTPRSNDTWNYLKDARTNDPSLPPMALPSSEVSGVTFNCSTSLAGGHLGGGHCFFDSRPMRTQWSEIYLNRDSLDGLPPAPLNIRVQHLVAHESGHAMMLAHNPLDPGSIVHTSGDPSTQFPNSNDIGADPDCSAGGFGIRCIYGSW